MPLKLKDELFNIIIGRGSISLPQAMQTASFDDITKQFTETKSLLGQWYEDQKSEIARHIQSYDHPTPDKITAHGAGVSSLSIGSNPEHDLENAKDTWEVINSDIPARFNELANKTITFAEAKLGEQKIPERKARQKAALDAMKDSLEEMKKDIRSMRMLAIESTRPSVEALLGRARDKPMRPRDNE